MLDDSGIYVDFEFVTVAHDIVRRAKRFQWKGAPVANISMQMAEEFAPQSKPLRAGDHVQIGPFLVEVIEFHFEGYFTVRRLDDRRLYSWLLGKWYRIKQHGRMVRRRLIMTLAVWDLAVWPTGEEPNWAHVRRRFSTTAKK